MFDIPKEKCLEIWYTSKIPIHNSVMYRNQKQPQKYYEDNEFMNVLNGINKSNCWT